MDGISILWRPNYLFPTERAVRPWGAIVTTEACRSLQVTKNLVPYLYSDTTRISLGIGPIGPGPPGVRRPAVRPPGVWHPGLQ
jgi:hypothetical protein